MGVRIYVSANEETGVQKSKNALPKKRFPKIKKRFPKNPLKTFFCATFFCAGALSRPSKKNVTDFVQKYATFFGLLLFFSFQHR